MSTDNNSIWVGEFKNGGLIVYDPALQFDGEHALDNEIHIYMVDSNQARAIDKNIVRELLRAVKDTRRETAIKDYLKWKNKNSSKYIQYQKKLNATIVREQEKRKEMLLIKRKDYLQKLGIIQDPGYVQLTKYKHRQTHCYNCKCKLDNAFHIQCIRCKWIICECGACGCGFSGNTNNDA